MYDPTIFENLKVAFENEIYDRDNITGEVTITNRSDILDLAVMSRELKLLFKLVNKNFVTAEIVLRASLKELAAEILEVSEQHPGCSLYVRFTKHLEGVSAECSQIESILQQIWKLEKPPVQTLSFVYGKEPIRYTTTTEITFTTGINENNLSEIPNFIEHILRSLVELNAI